MSGKLSVPQQAIRNHDASCVVVAGPGSGKTTTSVAKILRIAQAPRKIVAVTFTRDGAEELRKRIHRNARVDAKSRITVGTFHALIFRHLEAHGKAPKLASPAQSRMFLSRVAYLAPPDDQDNLQLIFEEIKCTFGEHPRASEAWFVAYQRTLEQHNMRDFYDAVRDCVIGMQQKTIPLFDCTDLLVDEAQDCDDVQYTLISLHAQAGVRCTLVGDDDQTIYEWRRALGYEGMMRFVNQHGAALLPLTENYRSLKEIVSHADALIQHNTARVSKEFLPRRSTGGRVNCVIAGSVDDQNNIVASWLESQAVPFDDSSTPLGFPHMSVAILSRNNIDLNHVQAELSRFGIRTYRPGSSFWDSPQITTFLALCLLAGGSERTEVLDEILGACGVSISGIESTINQLKAGGLTAWLGTLLKKGHTADGDWAVISELHKRLPQWRAQVEGSNIKLALLGTTSFVEANFRAPKSLRPQTLANTLRAARERLLQFPAHLTIEQRITAIKGSIRQQTPEASVHLMTMHGSKGLEWDTVIIIRADETVMPGGADRPEDAERRLFYVAMTRAKNQLVVMATTGSVSKFVAEAEIPISTSPPELSAHELPAHG